MFHYLFTNDLRISSLEYSLIEAGRCFNTNTVPTASEDKSTNNNMMTLGFYFNLYNGSNCAKLAAEGNVRKVVLNFIRKFQFPNMRTAASYNEAVADGIKLVPMRLIVKLLFTMQMSEGNLAYLTRNEITNFIFYNNNIAKVKNPNVVSLYADILRYRKTKEFPSYIVTKTEDRVWKQDDRQVREMIKILMWSGFVSEDTEGNIKIKYSTLSNEDKADIFEIVNSVDFWDGNTIESYREYMDAAITEEESNIVHDGSIEYQVTKERTFNEEFRLTGGRNILLYGVPGSGKSHTIETNYCNDFSLMERVVFHPDYMNTDFVGQILPTVKGEGDEKEITYDFTSGPFTRVLKKAINDPGKHYYLVIEEINRGNAPAIFGEIFQLLDRESNGTSSYKITNYNIANEVFGKKETPIFIPSNLSILATMNTADQNVFTLDTAFQRRWNMKMIENDVAKADHAKTNILDTTITWEKFNTVINEQIITSGAATLSSEDKRLGSYFVTKDVLKYFSMEMDKNEISEKYNISLDNAEKLEIMIKDLNSRFGDKVIKYLWDDVFKFSRDDLFEPNYKSLEKVLYDFNKLDSNRRFDIFKQDIKDNLFSDNNTEGN